MGDPEPRLPDDEVTNCGADFAIRELIDGAPNIIKQDVGTKCCDDEEEDDE
jgi:hypothetical protein